MEQKFKPRKAFAYELGIAIRTFERKIKDAQIMIPKAYYHLKLKKIFDIPWDFWRRK